VTLDNVTGDVKSLTTRSSYSTWSFPSRKLARDELDEDDSDASVADFACRNGLRAPFPLSAYADPVNDPGVGFLTYKHKKVTKDYFVMRAGQGDQCSIVQGDFSDKPDGAIGGATTQARTMQRPHSKSFPNARAAKRMILEERSTSVGAPFRARALLETSQTALEAIPARLNRGGGVVQPLLGDIPIHDLPGARFRPYLRSGEGVGDECRPDCQQDTENQSQ
jgi:hypothetical protein